MNKMYILFAALVISLLAVGVAQALPAVDWIKINEDNVDFRSNDQSPVTNQFEVQRGDTLTVKVRVKAAALAAGEANPKEHDVEVEAAILGYEYNARAGNRLSDATDLFDMDGGDIVTKTLRLTVPDLADKDRYDLRIRVGSRTGIALEQMVRLNLKGERHDLQIKDVVLSPEDTIQAGRYLIGTVRIKNIGQNTEEGIKIRIEIPALGVAESDYIEELKAEKSVTSEELLLRIPVNAQPGDYNVISSVEFDEGFAAETSESTITVVGSADGVAPSTEKTMVNVGIESQDVAAGASAVYPIVLTNTGSASKTYTVAVSGTAGWATATVQPSNVVTVGAGETSTVSVVLTANSNAAAGEKAFVAEVKSAGKTVQIPLKANVAGSSASGWGSIKSGLEIAVIVLVVLLVIIGLIIGFNRLKGNGEEPEEKTYY
ncbi:hypothetical protein HY491_01480 [Candidatus Woesearchaeota archaeon]|nr:hypothetical protein [Candidatus Woesearchaeota archaeon]